MACASFAAVSRTSRAVSPASKTSFFRIFGAGDVSPLSAFALMIFDTIGLPGSRAEPAFQQNVQRFHANLLGRRGPANRFHHLRAAHGSQLRLELLPGLTVHHLQAPANRPPALLRQQA